MAWTLTGMGVPADGELIMIFYPLANSVGTAAGKLMKILFRIFVWKSEKRMSLFIQQLAEDWQGPSR